MTVKIALIGEGMIELNGEPFGRMQQQYGGDVLNTAIYLARVIAGQAQVSLVSAMGSDALSRGMLERWQNEAINTDLVLIDEHHQPGLYLIQLDSTGERTFLYWRNDAAARYLLQHPEFPQVSVALAQQQLIYLSGISLAILPQADREQLIAKLATYQRQGATIIFDSNYRPTLWKSVSETRACYQQLYAITDLALVTLEDEIAVWGDEGLLQACNRLHASKVKQVIIKVGAEGCYVQDFADATDQLTHYPAPNIANVVDTTAAGDAFNAGFIAGLITKKPLNTAIEMGQQLAGRVIQFKGAIIQRADMQKIIEQFSTSPANCEEAS